MATAAFDQQSRSFSIGNALSLGFGTVTSNPVVALGIAFLLSVLPSVIVSLASRAWNVPALMVRQPGAAFFIGLVSGIIMIAFAMITVGAQVRATVAHSEGRKASLGESLGAGMRVILPVFVLSLIVGILSMLGMVFFIVPGVMLYVMWSVATPALVAEHTGISAALGRSRALTKGARWQVFAILLLLLIGMWVVGAVVAAITFTSAGGFAGMVAQARTGGSVPVMIVNVIVNTVVSAVWSCVQAATYVELRRSKDGPGSAELADIFS